LVEFEGDERAHINTSVAHFESDERHRSEEKQLVARRYDVRLAEF